VKLNSLGQEFINEIVTLVVQYLLNVTADNGFIGFY
jgi:hypothetical protein